MPQIIIKGLKREDVIKMSIDLPEYLSDVSNTPIDYFTMERVQNEYFSSGKVFDMYPLIEVVQFDRGKEVESKMARIIQKQVKNLGYKECEVYFTHIDKEDYYE